VSEGAGVVRVGVVSDTHGLLRPEVLSHLRGVDHILHAGDVGDIAILETLRGIAPVTAIRGNIDGTGPCAALPATEVVELGGTVIYMLHALAQLDLHPHAAGFGVVVSGHTHRAEMRLDRGVLYLNPGSIGPRRFRLPVTMAQLVIAGGSVSAEIIELTP
jgi:putative phosphoesterase